MAIAVRVGHHADKREWQKFMSDNGTATVSNQPDNDVIDFGDSEAMMNDPVFSQFIE